MASFYDRIPGFWDAVARETVGRDAAYLRLPKLVAGIVLRPLTLRDYLRLSSENSPFIVGGVPGRDDCAFLLWHQRAEISQEDTPQSFAQTFDAVDLGFLAGSCSEYVSQALADAPGGSGVKQASYYSVGAMLITTFRRAYPGTGREEILSTPMDELFQELRALHPHQVMFNPSDRLKGQYLADLQHRQGAPQAKPAKGAKRSASKHVKKEGYSKSEG